ncbi:hypothetical protein [Streptomyces sp. NBC_00989]|uniref:hypothetical protein n=1 Tax=Streptomyces sp. NBC_00989 TaxID=2903705 RepID=UPI0038657292|nr:hypothetical protein OG714_34670 [Streptomyces sp. NBC_00989]
MTTPGEPFELAHYYPGWIWHPTAVERMKSLLLFFDGYVLLLPQQHFDTTVAREEDLAVPLHQAGLLHNLDPKIWLDRDTARTIREVAIRASQSRYPSSGNTITDFHFISRMENASRIVRQMLRSGSVTVRRPDLGPDMVEMPAHARSAVLLALGLAACEGVSNHRIHLVGSLGQVEAQSPEFRHRDNPLLARAKATGRLVHNDLVDVGIDMSGIPLDEVLAFRREHGKGYRQYARGLRQFVAALERADTAEQQRLLLDRTEEIADAASDLRRARRAWGRPVVSLALAGAGAVWTLHQADLIGAVFGALGAAAGFTSPERRQSAFTYLFEARRMQN